MWLGDFHLHSQYSDGELTIAQLVDLYGQRGFGAIAITDHLCEEESFLGKAARFLERTLTRETFPQYMAEIRREQERAWDQYRMRLIAGVEITKNSILNHRSAHILALGVNDWISADGDVTEIIHKIHAQGALAIAAHPVPTGKFEPQTFHLWNRREELATLFDAWEVASGSYLFPEVLQSRLPKIASSDLHRPGQLQSWKTSLACERHPEAILRDVRRQQIDFVFYQEPATARINAPSANLSATRIVPASSF